METLLQLIASILTIRASMINKSQYKRLTMILLIPLLGVGGWLAEKEIISPVGHTIICTELKSNIDCFSSSLRKGEVQSLLHQYSPVIMSSALIMSGFSHPVVTVGNSKIKYINGETVVTDPIGGEVKKTLRLPPEELAGNLYSSCRIYSVSGSNKNWMYSCAGGYGETFYFQEEKTNKKFREARKEIEEQRRSNEKKEIMLYISAVLSPIFIYIMLSFVFVFLVKIVRFVIHGGCTKKN